MSDDKNAFSALRQVVRTLIGPDGCPWDREQTPESLCDYVVEEAFELVEAIRAGDTAGAREELGDVMFLLLFIGELYERAGGFSLAQALEDGAAKMVRRHPHVFSDTKVGNMGELFANWERIKREEKGTGEGEDKPKGLFDSLPKGLPPLLRAYRIHAKAARNGFTWESDAEVERQLDSERREFQEALAGGDEDAKLDEFGDYLFTLVELGRRKGLKANAALDAANRKFLERFQAMEALAATQGRSVPDMSLDELNTLWEQVKADGAK